jgi:hypothetical protein
MERLHLHTIQQIHLELADARERSGTYNGESHLSQTNSKDVSQFVQSNGNQLDGNRGGTSGGNAGALSNGSSDNVSSYASTDNASTQVNCTFWIVIVIYPYKEMVPFPNDHFLLRSLIGRTMYIGHVKWITFLSLIINRMDLKIERSNTSQIFSPKVGSEVMCHQCLRV